MSEISTTKKFVAHVKQDNRGSWDIHPLDEHLLAVEKLAKYYAEDFCPEWAALAGKWHDLGKFRKKFQDYIRINSGYEKENAHIENGKRAPHSTAGAIHAVKTLPNGFGHIIAYLIAGHHAGLPDWEGGRGGLAHRLSESENEYKEAMSEQIPKNILEGDCPEISSKFQSPDVIALWMRMLFSALVDADFLDTELYMQPEKANRRDQSLSLLELRKRFEASMNKLKEGSEDSPLANIRNNILDECLSAAEWQPGIFSLTVPTGGGKTLSSLAFALKHAEINNKRRIIYAIPFTSIIEQNAEVFRKFLGEDAVLEHHSSLDVDAEKENSRSRLAAENWDAPLIVTTNVQLFESLHSSRTSRCRKLHNIVNSIIILDEAQQLPRDFHAPITKVMQQLSDHFGVTWVLCTATQPVLNKSVNPFGQVLLEGLKEVREIVSNPVELAGKLERVDVQMPKLDDPKLNWEELAKTLSTEDCVLVIVNTRRNARELFELLPGDGNKLHLSANMCAEHRSEVIQEIKFRLWEREKGNTRPLRVVSTQLIEAGVDVDFPVVYRSIAGLDSIAQSAGRCNREGKMQGLGKVIVFKPEKASPPGFLLQGEITTLEMIAGGQLTDPLAPESFEKYFSLMNEKGGRDKHGILQLLKASSSPDAPLAIQFKDAASKFRLIDDSGESIVVPFVPEGEEKSPVEAWIRQLEYDPSIKRIYKKLQRYTITVPKNLKDGLLAKGCLEERAGLWVLLDVYYQKQFGVVSPESLIEVENCVI